MATDPLGSTSAEVMLTNVKNLDIAVNDTDADTWTDRLGNERLTWQGIENAGTGDPALAIEAAQTAVTASQLSQSARDEAVAAASLARLTTGIYPDIAAGLAATQSGKYFSVPAGDGTTFLVLYRNVSGEAVESGQYPDARAVASLLKMSVTGFTLPIILDSRGVHGTAKTIYIGRTLYQRVQGGAVINLTGIGSASSRFPDFGYTEVTYTDASVLYLVYLDSATPSAGYQIARFDSLPSGTWPTLIPVCSVWYNKIWDCNADVIYAEDRRGQFYTRAPIAIEGTKIRFPSFAWSNAEISVNTLPDAGGQVYPNADMTFPTAKTAQILAYDHSAKMRGGTGFVVSDYPADPESPFIYPLLYSFYGVLSPAAGVVVVGDGVPGTLLRNLYAAGKNNPDGNTMTIGKPVYTEITDDTLNALDYTRGFKAASSGNVYIGAKLLDMQPGKWAFVRIFVQTDQDDSVGLVGNAPRVSWHTPATGSSAEDMVLLKRHSARVFEYGYWGKMPVSSNASAVYDAIVVGGSVTAGRNIVFTCPQIGYGAAGMAWIKSDDWPVIATSVDERLRRVSDAQQPVTVAELLHSEHLWTVEERPFTLYPRNLLASSSEGTEHAITLAGTLSDRGNLPLVTTLDSNGEVINPVNLPPSAILSARLKSDSVRGTRKIQNVTVHTVDEAHFVGKSPRILAIGDSLIEYSGTVVALKRKLVALGATPEFLGTVTAGETNFDGTSTGQTCPAEGRRSRAFADYTYSLTTNLSPVTDWTAYLALSSDNRRSWNPFVRAATGSDNTAYVHNGYIFDLRFYLDRAGYADPDFVLINLGANDYGQNTDKTVAAAQVLDGMTILYNQVRAALPNAAIVFVTNSMAWNDNSVSRWNTDYGPLIRQVLEFVPAHATDTKLFALDNHARVNREWGFQYVTPVVGSTKVTTVTMNNDLHYAATGNEEWAEGALALIGNNL